MNIQQLPSRSPTEIIYPDSDGQPMADNTKQFRWIVVIKENLELLFANDENVFVAGDLLWYPVQGNNIIRRAPDAMVVFGRPKGDRGSYKQWEEANLPPRIVFEVLSPGNTLTEMAQKLEFYDRYGVEEYYLYDPDRIDLSGWLRQDNRLTVIENLQDWISPRLKIRFELSADEMQIFTPSGTRFLTFVELAQLKKQTEQQLEQTEQQLEQTEQLLNQERQQTEQSQVRIQALEARLRELGIDPNV
ncbi:MAG: Uma2 family endonuclease [Microcystaceae cyanobacterium]